MAYENDRVCKMRFGDHETEVPESLVPGLQKKGFHIVGEFYPNTRIVKKSNDETKEEKLATAIAKGVTEAISGKKTEKIVPDVVNMAVKVDEPMDDLKILSASYFEKFQKEVPLRYKKDVAWITSKLTNDNDTN